MNVFDLFEFNDFDPENEGVEKLRFHLKRNRFKSLDKPKLHKHSHAVDEQEVEETASMTKGMKSNHEAFKVQEARKPDVNFDIEDIKRLEQIKDLATLKTQAMALIAKPSAKPMRPEKVEWFRSALERMDSPMKVIKLMYDLMLSGEGHQVIGSRRSMNPNSYRSRFGEQDIKEVSNDLLGRYKKSAGADASAADKRGDIERGNKRFRGIVKATIKQGENDAKKHKAQGVAEGSLNEIYKMPPTKNSSQGLADWAYNDAVKKNAEIIFQDSNTVVFQVGADMIRYIILSEGQPILYLGLTKFLDGWKSGVVAAETEARGQGLATKIYLQASDLLKQPIYSDTTQTDASRLGIWNKLIQMVPSRVVGFDQKTNNNLPLAMTNDGPVVNQNQPLYVDRNKKDSEKPVTQQQRYRTRILKLLPNKQGVAEGSLEEYGDTAKGQKMLTKVQKRAVDRMIKADDNRDKVAAKKNQETANRAWDRMTDKDVAEGSSGAKYKIKSIGKDKNGDYYISPNTGKKVYKQAKVGDHETPRGEVKSKVAEGNAPRFLDDDFYAYDPRTMEIKDTWSHKSVGRRYSEHRAQQQGWLVVSGMRARSLGLHRASKNEAKQRLDPKCWTGYKKQGTKMKGGVRVNNCVPAESIEEENKGLYYNVNKRKKAGTSRPAGHPKAPTAQAWKDAAKTAKKEGADPGISKDKETKFHAKLDQLVHDTFGKRQSEMMEALEEYLYELELAGYEVINETKTRP